MTVGKPGELFRCWYIDCTYLSRQGSRLCGVVLARESLSGWPEGRMFHEVNAQFVAWFTYEEIICCWSVFEVLVSDNGPENGAILNELLNQYKVWHVQIAPYNSQGNGFIEVSHQMFISALRKLTRGTGECWHQHFYSVLWAERMTV